jgi:hypothetical protein
MYSKLKGDLEHNDTIQTHPRGTVRLLQIPAQVDKKE